MKCTHTLFTKEGLITNIGNYLLIFSIIFFTISAFIFYKCGFHFIEHIIYELKMKKEIDKKCKTDIEIFSKKHKIKNKKKSKKNHKYKSISNPKKKISNCMEKKHKIKKLINIHNSTSKVALKSTNIIININKTAKNKITKKDSTQLIYDRNIIIKEKQPLVKKYIDCELNLLNYNNALNYDNRTFFQYYFSLLKYNNTILFSFYPVDDYNLKIIKISILILSLDIYFFINSLFFDNKSIHKIYEDGGSYNISYFMPKIIYSFIISYYIIVIIKYFSLSQRDLLDLKNEDDLSKLNDKIAKTRRCLSIKYIGFYTISFLFLVFFWYYLSSFCAIYRNSQFYVIKNTFISFAISLLFPFYLIY